ncbi:MAG TPA: DUF1499 domain-containing protein [Stellaceae bacterium]|nr:DUF1499 domain-containing protein [Stellaceae bacterium]
MSGDDEAAPARRRGPLLAGLGLFLGIGALLALAAGPFGYRLDIVDRGTALGTLPRYAAYAGIGAAAVSLVGILMSIRARRLGWIMAALLGCLAGSASAYLPWSYIRSVEGAPAINDITTDTDNPPAFETLARVRETAHAVPATYGGPEYAAKQKQAYPEIQPLHLALSPADAFARALEQVRRQGWTMAATDPVRGRIEASARTPWYGFTDDVVLRITADDSGSRVDMRSKSRVGTGDRGVNAARIREFLAALRAAAEAPG